MIGENSRIVRVCKGGEKEKNLLGGSMAQAWVPLRSEPGRP